MKEILNKALQSKYEAQRDEALATLEVYYNNAAGIGEHPQIIEEMSKQVEILTNAQDCLKTIQSLQ
jgi:hypothetical protein|tara:strand:+ start:14563 stop:14760 length:198 start_codon:yes stop_codon:yes gene_type:complete